jgi:phosphoribosylamine--glycine ligase
MKANNPGIAELCEGVELGSYSDVDAIKAFAKEVEPDFAIVGPEDPLEKGVADMLESISVPTVGPKKILARLETSKSFTRDLMAEYNIKGNPKFKIFRTMDGIKSFLKSLDGFVVKPDGLTGGKGVKVQGEHLKDAEDVLRYCEDVLETHDSVIVEEKLDGEEFSLQCLTDGRTVVATPPVQDHKRAYEDDTGPNTGGMGSYSCEEHLLPFMKQEHVNEGLRITQEVADALYKETGEYYKGIMYAGLIITKTGVKLIEYNARFGDPEAMNTLPVLKTDFIDVCQAIVNGTLDKLNIEFEKKATVCKYAVPKGYPDNPIKGEKVDVSDVPGNAILYYASVDKKDDGLYMTGSRAIGVVGVADSLAQAQEISEQAVSKVKGDVFHRADIGTAKLIQKRIDHMKRL